MSKCAMNSYAKFRRFFAIHENLRGGRTDNRPPGHARDKDQNRECLNVCMINTANNEITFRCTDFLSILAKGT